MGVTKDSGCTTKRKIWGAMGGTIRNKRNMRKKNLSTDKCSKQERCATSVERHVSEEVFLVISIGGTMRHFTRKPNPMYP